ncbi:MAG TPA: hypothetical protein DEV93_11025 [Chloroflexi bacterium]|nr:hypothetical protein [Chloroflexota bacterium]
MVERDKDADFKLRTCRFLWHMGFACSMEASLSSRVIRYGKLKRYDLTDIDVVGVRFDSDLTWQTVVADCKSGKESAINRLFWLRGVMTFLGADRGYLVMKSIGPECREVALRMNVSLMDEENLTQYETDKSLDVGSLNCFTLSAYDRNAALWGLQFPKNYSPNDAEQQIQKLFNYLSYNYWFNQEYRNIQVLLSALENAAPAMEAHPDKERMKVAAYTALLLWSISLLKMCGSVIATKGSEIHNEVRRYIFGSAANANERAHLMRMFSKLSESKVRLEPDYYGELLELASRMIKFSHHAKSIPRYVQQVLFSNILCAKADSLATLLGGQYSVDSLKLAKDVAHFVCKATGLKPEVFSELLSQ